MEVTEADTARNFTPPPPAASKIALKYAEKGGV